VLTAYLTFLSWIIIPAIVLWVVFAVASMPRHPRQPEPVSCRAPRDGLLWIVPTLILVVPLIIGALNLLLRH
jgi:heme/copper-type cytochrome/quinol oxidase subunit 2